MVTSSRSVGTSRAVPSPAPPNGAPGHARKGARLGRGWAMARFVIAPVLVTAVAGLAGAVACQARPTATVAPIASTPMAATGATIRVHVSGAVQSPGVYELHVGDRVAEALRAAGGTTIEADDAVINLAQRVHDEQRLDVPVRAASPTTNGAGSVVATPPIATPRVVAPTSGAPVSGATASGAAPPSGTDAELDALLSAPANPEGGARINVNQATLAQLEKLPGIGAVSAKRLVTWKAENGPLRTVADLREAGLTAAVLRKALPYLALG